MNKNIIEVDACRHMAAALEDSGRALSAIVSSIERSDRVIEMNHDIRHDFYRRFTDSVDPNDIERMNYDQKSYLSDPRRYVLPNAPDNLIDYLEVAINYYQNKYAHSEKERSLQRELDTAEASIKSLTLDIAVLKAQLKDAKSSDQI